MLRASDTVDLECKKLCKQILLVPKEVKYNCLYKFCMKCYEVHSLAFL